MLGAGRTRARCWPPEVASLRAGRTLGSRPGADTSWATSETPRLSGSGGALPSAPTFGGPQPPRPRGAGASRRGGAGSPGREARGASVRVAAGSGPLPPPRPGCARSASLAAKRSGEICGRTSRGSGARTPARSEQRRLAERELSAASGTFSLFLSEHRPPHTLLALAQPREAAQSNCCCNATPAESFYVPCTQCHLGLNVPDFLYSSGPWFSTNDAFAPRGPSAAPGGRPSGRHTWGREAAADT